MATVQELETLYSDFVWNINKKNECAYCGYYATDDEHITPRSYMGTKKKNMRENISKNNIVRSCRECNTLASNKVFNTFFEKKEYIRNAVEKKWRKVIDMKEWEEEELEELEGNFKVFIFASVRQQKIIKRRMEKLSSI